MIKTQFFLFGVEVSALTAELHFVNWILALEQECNPVALAAVNGHRCVLEASHAFSLSAHQRGEVSCLRLTQLDTAITASGLFIRTAWVP